MNARPDEVYLTTLTLDDPELYPPEEHIRDVERVSWFRVSDSLPRSEEFSAAHGFRQHQTPSTD